MTEYFGGISYSVFGKWVKNVPLLLFLKMMELKIQETLLGGMRDSLGGVVSISCDPVTTQK